jgi:hypothetical protein
MTRAANCVLTCHEAGEARRRHWQMAMCCRQLPRCKHTGNTWRYAAVRSKGCGSAAAEKPYHTQCNCTTAAVTPSLHAARHCTRHQVSLCQVQR